MDINFDDMMTQKKANTLLLIPVGIMLLLAVGLIVCGFYVPDKAEKVNLIVSGSLGAAGVLWLMVFIWRRRGEGTLE